MLLFQNENFRRNCAIVYQVDCENRFIDESRVACDDKVDSISWRFGAAHGVLLTVFFTKEDLFLYLSCAPLCLAFFQEN